MTVSFIRVLFLLFAAVVGFQIGSAFFLDRPESGILGAAAGAGISALVIWLETSLARISMRGLSAAVFGLLLAMIVSRFVTRAIDMIGLDPFIASSLKLVVVLILAYLGMVLAMRGRDEFNIIIPYVKLQRQNQSEMMILVDTSAIIDGRLSDIVKTRFLEGHFIVPQFVLHELQQLADSADSLKRGKGRRGLDILDKLRKDKGVSLRIHEEDFPDVGGVDSKLVKLAKLLDARILTTDFNLNKVADLQDVGILNVNELSNALKPVVMMGDKIRVTLVKEGKERDQALAYLADGTMVVVDQAKSLIGAEAEVHVASVLQTAAGRMIFAKLGTP